MKTTTLEIKVILVDDEFAARENVRTLLNRLFPHITIVGEAATIEEGIALAKALLPDIVFLDVRLPDGDASVFLEATKHLHLKVVVVTGESAFAVQAFKYNAIHFLLKPIDREDLKEAIDRVMAMAPTITTPKGIHHPPLTSIQLAHIGGFEVLAVKDILYCEADGNATKLHLVNGRRKTSSRTLGHFEELLQHSWFSRIHNSYLVNLSHVSGYHRGTGGQVELTNGTMLDVSARKKDDFLADFEAFQRPR